MNQNIPLVLIGDPHSKRMKLFLAEAHNLGIRSIQLLTYPEVMRHGLSGVSPGSLIRLDSPCDCVETARLLLKHGIEPMLASGAVPVTEAVIDQLEFVRGEMLHPKQWFLGFKQLLEQLNVSGKMLQIDWVNSPASIICCFDKSACLNLWQEHQLAIPLRYPSVKTYHELRQLVNKSHARLFIKLRYGYSALGGIALEWCGSKVRAITTMQVDWNAARPRLYLSKKPHYLLREFEIAWLIDTLAIEGIIVEDWLTKARHQGKSFDLRVVMIDQQMHHVVGRASSSPFTNLNLDAMRVDASDIKQMLGAHWLKLNELVSKAANTLPEARMLGIDVIIKPDKQSFCLLEANAFGDYLPQLQHAGMSTHETLLRHLITSHSMLPQGVSD